MGRRTWTLFGAVLLGLAPSVVAGPAGAVAGTFSASCVTTGIHGPVTSFRTTPYSASAPDSVAPGSTFKVPVSIGYDVPANAMLGAASFVVTGAVTEVAGLAALPGASAISGALEVTAPDAAGGIVTIAVREYGAAVQIGSFQASEVCTPSRTTVIATIAVGVPQVSIGDAAVVEGSSGTRALSFPLTLSRPASTNVTVAFDTEDGTAFSGFDYNAVSGSVTIPAGLVTGVAQVRVRGDQQVEPKENFRVRLHNASGAVLGRSVGTGRIIDDDPELGLRLSIGDSSVVEGARGTRSARFVVTLLAPAAQPVHFHYVTIDGSATAGVDYRAQESDYFIPAGASSISVPVPVIADTIAEPNRSFTVRLSSPETTIGRANGVGTVIDDD